MVLNRNKEILIFSLMIKAIFISPQLHHWVVLPLLIFMARVIDVSIGTVRIILITRGKRNIASLLGFIELLIWLLAISQIFKNLDNIVYYLAYAGGYATGIYVGMHIENKMAIGIQIVRIITRRDASQLLSHLKSEGYGVTTIDGQGTVGPVKVIFTIIKRKDTPHLFDAVQRFNPQAVISAEDVRFAEQATLRKAPSFFQNSFLNRFKFERRGK